MADLHYTLAGRATEVPVIASAAFLIFAFASKAALFPTLFWLPASYHTPSVAVSALFAALLTKVGVYALLRVFTLVYDIEDTPIQTVLLVAAVLTLAVGAAGALVQRGMRRVLGFGIITSVGTMILGLAVYTPLAIGGALFYLFQDVIGKANLFLGAGVVRRLSGSEEFDRAGGLWRAAPLVSLLFLVPALSIAGVPPFSGFWAKLLLLRATLEADAPLLLFAILASGFLTLFAMGRLWAEVFWASHPGGPLPEPARVPAAMTLPLVVLTALAIGIGVAAGPFIDVALAAGAALADPSAYLAAVLPEVVPE
jgi:multicomponent Na+:H+ antiporter subunit D